MNIKKLKNIVLETIDANKEEIFALSKFINENPEVAYKEKNASAAIIKYLETKGFRITKKLAGLETAFVADFGVPEVQSFPVAFTAEYDALEGVGHGCGHNLIAAASVSAAVGVSCAIKNTNSGVVRLLGTPAEEILTESAGKNRLLEAGIFKNIEACLMFHPWKETGVALKDFGCRSYRLTFNGKSAHAAADPWNGLNALDAAVIFYNSISMFRQQLSDETRLHCIITKGGNTINIIPNNSEIEVMLRSTEVETLFSMEKRLKACAKASATATGCTYKFKQIAAVKPINFNEKLFNLVSANAKLLGKELKTLPIWEASSDFGDVSHEIPAMCLLYKTHESCVNWHSTEVAKAAHEKPANDEMLNASKILALAAIDIIFNNTPS